MCRSRCHADSCFREQPQQEKGGRAEAVLKTLHQGCHLDVDHHVDDQPCLRSYLVKKNNSIVDRILEKHYQQYSFALFHGRFPSVSKVTSLTISFSSSLTNCSVDDFLLPAGSQMHYQLIRYDPEDWFHHPVAVSVLPILYVQLLLRYNYAIGCLLQHEQHHGRIDPWTTIFSNADDEDDNHWLSQGCAALVDCRNVLLNDNNNNNNNNIVKDIWDGIIRNNQTNDTFRNLCIPLLIEVLKTLGQVWFRLGHAQPAHDCIESSVALKWLVRELEWEQQQQEQPQHQHYQEPAYQPPATLSESQQQHPVEPPDFEPPLSLYYYDDNNHNRTVPAVSSHPSLRQRPNHDNGSETKHRQQPLPPVVPCQPP